MKNIFNVLDFVSNFLIKLLNKFKFQNPLVYGLVVTAIIWLLAQIQGGSIVVPEVPVLTSVLNIFGIENMNNFATGTLILVLAGVAPHTEKKVEEMN